MSSQDVMVRVKSEATVRSKAPVFVLGCGRSGTTLLYHMLLSAGNFAVYRTESNAINLLEPRFGDLRVRRNKERLMQAWLASKLYERSGLDAQSITAKVVAECRNGGDFLRIIMTEMARQQNVERWADCTPEHLLYLPRIKETIPDALIIHIIRDGRDVALSTAKLGYVRRMWWDHTPNVMVAGLYWEWMVRKGREDGRKLGQDYIEVRFEQLISDPRSTLATLSRFVEQELDYDQILKVGIGSVSEPNTSFKGTSRKFDPLRRWKSGYTPEHLAMFEAMMGTTLQELGYELGTMDRSLLDRADMRRMRAIYRGFFGSKLWLKAKTPLGKFMVTRDLSWL
ncbi:MAG TPA: sulfotransferase [Candidatus Eisenbacteria bacterium]|nr:sulfotransferase [Candidatus Eisenbacteria bacterium]